MAGDRICPQCNTIAADDASFCEGCGAALSRACPSCGTELAPGQRFCDGCGAPVAAAPSAPGAPLATPPPAAMRPPTPRVSPSLPAARRAFLLPAALLGVGLFLVIVGAAFAFRGGSDGDNSFSRALSNSGAFNREAPVPVDAKPSGGALDNEDAILGDEGARPTARPTSAVTPQATRSTAWRVVLEDSFDSDAGLWPTGDFEEGSATRTRDVAGGVYSFSLESDGGWLAPELVPVDVGSDFYVAVDALRQLGGPEAICGLIIAGTGTFPRVALLAADMDGRFRVYRLAEQGAELENLIALTPSSAIRAGSFNSLAVISQGSRLAFYINNEKVGEIDDSLIGNVERAGVVTGLWDVRGAATCLFDNFEVRVP
jgi:hypothetical protein